MLECKHLTETCQKVQFGISGAGRTLLLFRILYFCAVLFGLAD